jgi:esterase/lipase superfamily enzyme
MSSEKMWAASESRLLVEAVATVWPELAGLVEDRAAVEEALLGGLRALDAALLDAPDSNDPTARIEQAQQQVLAAFTPYPVAHTRLITVLGELLGALDRGHLAPPDLPGAVSQARHLEVPVFYATDRATTTTDRDGWFSGERGELGFGVAWVSIPDDHRMAALEKPRWWRLEFRPNPERHVVLLDVEPAERAQFVAQAAAAVATARVPEALVFVHGYNVTFTDAARRAAQVAYDLHFEGLPMLYSWPSEGATLRYPVDENNTIWTRPHFAEFLRLVLGELGAQRVHALAHSMGNRVLTTGLAALNPAQAQRLGQIVFAAPDIDAAVFTQLANDFTRGAAGYTLYASSNDLALQASQRLARYPRAGQSGDGIVVVDGVDTIDASELDTGLMSHSYFGDRTSILSDLYYLIRDNTPASRRFGLAAATHPSGLRYWVFRTRHA